MGRRPLFDVPLTPAQRVQRWRQRRREARRAEADMLTGDGLWNGLVIGRIDQFAKPLLPPGKGRSFR